MKTTALPLLFLLAGCEIGEKDSDAHPTETDTYIKGAIVLMCDGEFTAEIDPVKGRNLPDAFVKQIEEEEKESGTYLIKIEDKEKSANFEYYRPEENRFIPSTCFFEFHECQASVRPDIITEFGKLIDPNNGSVAETTETIINRRTGAMRTIRTSLGVNYIFEGSCEPGQIPDQPPQKF